MCSVALQTAMHWWTKQSRERVCFGLGAKPTEKQRFEYSWIRRHVDLCTDTKCLGEYAFTIFKLVWFMTLCRLVCRYQLLLFLG